MAEAQGLDFTAPYEVHGVQLTRNGDNGVGDCPFCGKEEHFFVNIRNGKWKCQHCNMSGNLITFLGELIEKWYNETTTQDWERLEGMRGIPYEAFKNWKLAWNGYTWLIPSYSETGTVRDILRWNGVRSFATPLCKRQLFGMWQLSRAPKGSTVWVCEGEWDAMSMRWMLDSAGLSADVVVGVPGAGIFKTDWVPYFKDMHIILCYDNDKAGDDGSMRVGQLLKGNVKTLRYLCWPEGRPLGWDIRDFVKEGIGSQFSHLEGVEILRSLLAFNHRRDDTRAAIPPVADVQLDMTPAYWEDVMRIFESWLTIEPDFKDALAITLATCLSPHIPGDPLWFYIIGPPGGGKTVILMAMKTAECVSFHSTLTAKNLVSGYSGTRNDPSLLPRLDGKTAIFKDGTELLAMHVDARREAYGTLRGAYDGYVRKEFGNGTIREYSPHFNVLIGITPAVHGDSQSSLGERFLKIEMREQVETINEKIMMAIDNITHEKEMENELSDVCRRFLLRRPDPTALPPLPQWGIKKIVALSQLLSALRANVDREVYGDRDIRYRPSHETGTRIAKQLAKLAIMLTWVFDLPEMDHEVYRIISRVVIDTAIGYHLDIVKYIVNNSHVNGKVNGVLLNSMARDLGIPVSSLTRKLEDLSALGVIDRERMQTMNIGSKPYVWFLSDRFYKLWRSSYA